MSGEGLQLGQAERAAAPAAATALAALLEAYRGPITGYLVRCGVDAASRADLLQEIFIKLHRVLTSSPAPVPRVLVFTIAANTTRSYFRRLAVQRRVFADAPASEPS